MALSFCPNCGAERLPEARFCGACGFDYAAFPVVTEVRLPSAQAQRRPEHLTTSRRPLVGSIVAVVVLLAAAGGTYILSGSFTHGSPPDAGLSQPIRGSITSAVPSAPGGSSPAASEGTGPQASASATHPGPAASVVPPPAPSAIAQGTSLSSSGPFTTSTAVAKPGQSVKWQFDVGPDVAGEPAEVFVSHRTASGVWEVFQQVATVPVDASGLVRYSLDSSAPDWVSVRVYVAAAAGHSAVASRSFQAEWRADGQAPRETSVPTNNPSPPSTAQIESLIRTYYDRSGFPGQYEMGAVQSLHAHATAQAASLQVCVAYSYIGLNDNGNGKDVKSFSLLHSGTAWVVTGFSGLSDYPSLATCDQSVGGPLLP